MNPSHYPDLERCKKLTELGFPITEKKTFSTELGTSRAIRSNDNEELSERVYVCPSVMEMMDVVPKHFHDTTGEREDLTILYHKNGIDVGYAWFDVPVEERMIKADSVPNALADLVVWLVEKSHLTFDKR